MAKSKRFALDTQQTQALRCFQAGDYAGAIEAWQSVLRLFGEDAIAAIARALCCYNIGMSYLRMGLSTNAVQYLQEAIHLCHQALPPTTRDQRALRADAYFLLAQAYEQRGDIEQAHETYHTACHEYEDLGNLHRKTEALIRWAELLEEYGDPLWAVNLYNRARNLAWSIQDGFELAQEAEQAVERVLQEMIGVE